MNLDEIKNILRLMEDHKLVEFEHEDGGTRLKLRRADDRPAPAPPAPIVVPMAAAPVAVAAPAPAAGAAPAATERPANWVEFKSPLVGTFYRSPKPDADSFCNPGDEVGPEKVICIIEAMKVMNEIKAEMAGIIREILVKNGQAVEYGETLFWIEKK